MLEVLVAVPVEVPVDLPVADDEPAEEEPVADDEPELELDPPLVVPFETLSGDTFVLAFREAAMYASTVLVFDGFIPIAMPPRQCSP